MDIKAYEMKKRELRIPNWWTRKETFKRKKRKRRKLND